MFEKVFIIFLFLIATIEAGGKCPDDKNPPTAAVDCVLVPGCNFDNGSLTPLATQCSNQRSDADCQQLFPCPTAALTTPVAIPACNPNDAGGTAGTSTTYPYVRAPACLNPNLREIALQCKYFR